MKRRPLLIFWLITICFSSYGSVPSLTLDDNTRRVSIWDKADVYVDSSNLLTKDEVAAKSFSGNFKPTSGSKLADKKVTYWFRFTISDLSQDDHFWIFEGQDYSLDSISLFINTPEGISEISTMGDNIPTSYKPIDHKNLSVILPKTGPEPVEYFLKVRDRHGSSFDLVIKSAPFFINYSLVEYHLIGIFYGFLLSFLILNLFLFFNTKSKTYLFYNFYLISAIVYFMRMDGFGFQFIWGNFPSFNNLSLSFFTFLMVASFLIYSRNFLDLKRNSPFLDRVFISFIWLKVILIAVGIVATVFSLHNLLDPFLEFRYDTVAYILGLIASIKVYRGGFKPARYYMAGISFLLIGYTIFIMWITQIIPVNPFIFYTLNACVIIEVILFSVAIADKLKTLIEENKHSQKKIIQQMEENQQLSDKVNRELEDKVQSRTMELSRAKLNLEDLNEKLKKQSAEIDKMNQLLYKEYSKLEKDVKVISKDRIFYKPVPFEEFKKIYQNEDQCYKFLAELKWGEGFECRKCGGKKYAEGKLPFSRRCKSCNYVESAMVHTLFEGVRFPLIKAFYITSLVHYNQKMTATEIAGLVDLRKNTVWNFRKKVLNTLKARNKSTGWDEVVVK